MNYNNFWDCRDVTYESGTVTEPVTLTEIKDYLRLQGFVDDDESPSESLSDFNFDDDLLTDMIKAARENFEQSTGLSLVPKTLEAMITNLIGGQEILYGPVGAITELLDANGDEIISDNYSVIGIQWKRLQTPKQENMKITYEAGYTTVPAPIKIDLMRLVAFMYMNRGDDKSIEVFKNNLASKSNYSRRTWLV